MKSENAFLERGGDACVRGQVMCAPTVQHAPYVQQRRFFILLVTYRAYITVFIARTKSNFVGLWRV